MLIHKPSFVRVIYLAEAKYGTVELEPGRERVEGDEVRIGWRYKK